MEFGRLALLLVAVALVAIALDVIVIWTWRYVRQSRGKQDAAGRSIEPSQVPARFVRIAHSVDRRASSVLAAAFNAIRQAVASLRASETAIFRLCLVLACLATTASFGYLYADQVVIDGWQISAYLVCVAVATAALMPGGRTPIKLQRRHFWLVALFLVALGLRVVRLDELPGGLHVDEAGLADFTMRHILPPDSGTISPFRTGPSSQPALYHYIVRLSFAAFGENPIGLRISSALAGAAGVVATYALISLFQQRRTAIMAAVIVAASHFSIHWSRIGLNNIWDTLWVPLVLATYTWGWKESWTGGAVLSGLALGLSQYFYSGSRIALPLLAFLAYRLWNQDRDSVRLLAFGAKLVGIAAVVSLPLLIFGVRYPDLFLERVQSSLIWKPEGFGVSQTPADQLPSVGDQLVRAVFSFTSIPESAGFYRPGAPLVLGLAVPLLLAGLLWATYKRNYLPVLWFGLTVLLGGFLLHALPASNHYVVAIPALAWLLALALEPLLRAGRSSLAWALLAVVLITDLYFYFGVYAAAPPGDLIHPFPPNPWS